MAKNTENYKKPPKGDVVQLDEVPQYSGDFIGNLKGNADTATSLLNPFTVNVVGDASGHFSTAGSSTNLSLRVTKAAEADHANHAVSADNVNHAMTAQNAASANVANHAATASSATIADFANKAELANSAISAGGADYAATAGRANEAERANYATEANKAAHAETADVATKLLNDDHPVKEAEHALKADLAQMAQYDCQGLSFTHYYAKKDEIPEDIVTEEDINAGYVPRKEQILQAVVGGKATGHGVVNGNTLSICINSLATRDDGTSNIYEDINFVKAFDPMTADTTKIYVDGSGFLYVYDIFNGTVGGTPLNPATCPPEIGGSWIKINADLNEGIKDEIRKALEQLNNVVTLKGDQTITGDKTFTGEVKARIPTMLDDPRTVAVVHNLIDLKKQVDLDTLQMEYRLEKIINELEKQIKLQFTGSIQFAYKDYTFVTNQYEMQAGVIYFAYFTADKEFIQYDPQTQRPVNPQQEARYIRRWFKASSGAVNYYDIDTTPDLTGYMPITGGEFTGDIEVPDLEFTVNDKRVLNSKAVHKLVSHVQADFDTKLTNYMHKSGGEFTGPIGGPFLGNPLTANDKVYLNKGDMIKLIQDTSMSLTILDKKPAFVTDMNANVLYAYPVTISKNSITSIKLYSEPYSGSVADKEIIFSSLNKDILDGE